MADELMGVRGDGTPMSFKTWIRTIFEPHATPFTRVCPFVVGGKKCGGTMRLLPKTNGSDRYRCERCGNVKAY